MRDVLIIPFTSKESIVLASDNSGGLGLKERDMVKIDYETVGYYSLRVAATECISAGGAPFAVTLQNFCGDGAWASLVTGIKRGLTELELGGIDITGSTESNFTLEQSAIGLTVLGKAKNHRMTDLFYSSSLKLAVIGKPLVGQEVILQHEEIAPLSLFRLLSEEEGMVLLPVGSKGIHYELGLLFTDRFFTEDSIVTELDLHKSSGPATCFIIAYPEKKDAFLRSVAGEYFHEVIVVHNEKEKG